MERETRRETRAVADPPKSQGMASYEEPRWAAQIRFIRMHLTMLPRPYLSLDTSRMTALYFCVVGLDALGALEEETTAAEREAMVEWIYGLQVTPGGESGGGFRGSAWAGAPAPPGAGAPPAHDCDAPHLAMTYTALALLVTLGDDLARVDRAAVLAGVRRCARGDGAFSAAAIGCETDLRFVFCACAVSAFLDDFSAVDAAKTRAHVAACQAFDGGLALAPGGEAHGGSTYCGLAARALLARRARDPVAETSSAASAERRSAGDGDALDVDACVDWCARRHGGDGGVVGRTNKPPDSCYAYWVGAGLRCLGAGGLADGDGAATFVLSCENGKMGGFAKYPDNTAPDILHTFYSIAALSWTAAESLRPVDPTLGVCAHRLRRPH